MYRVAPPLRGGTADSWYDADWFELVYVAAARGDILSSDTHRLEKDVEEKWCDVAKRHGWKAYKFSSPGNSSVPDRLFLRKGFAFFIEFKRPGKEATKNQLAEHKILRDAGFIVWVIDYFDKEFAHWIFT